MPSKRRVLSLCGLAITTAVSGCLGTREASIPVFIQLRNEDTRAEWQLTVGVEDETGEEVFRTEESIPPNDGQDLGEVRIEDAFRGRTGDRFTVRAWLDGEPAGTFDYEITCQEDNRFTLDVEDRPFSAGDGDLVAYVDRWCAA